MMTFFFKCIISNALIEAECCCFPIYCRCVTKSLFGNYFPKHWYSGETTKLLTGSADNTCRLWDVETGKFNY